MWKILYSPVKLAVNCHDIVAKYVTGFRALHTKIRPCNLKKTLFTQISALSPVIIYITYVASTAFVVLIIGHFTVRSNVNALIKLQSVPMFSRIHLRVYLASTRARKNPRLSVRSTLGTGMDNTLAEMKAPKSSLLTCGWQSFRKLTE